jgi:hypothetical protein
MTKSIRQVKQDQERKRRALLPETFIAIIGNRDGTVFAGGNDIYIRDLISGQTVTAKNYTVPPTAGRLVLVEHRYGDLFVVSYWRIYGNSEEQSETVPPHSHGYAGGNADFIEAARFLPFLVLPVSTFTVRLYGGVIQKSDGTFLKVENQDIDLSSYQPAIGACWVLIEIDDAGTVNPIAGSTVNAKELLNTGNIPVALDTPIAAVRLYDGQAAVQRDPSGVNDFVDLRLFAARSLLGTLHNLLPDLQGGGDYITGDEFYHLNLYQWETLTHGLNADLLHSHAGLGDIAATIHAATEKTTPIDADEVGIWDSISNALRRLTWANIKATLKAYFDTLYAAIGIDYSGVSANDGDTDVTGAELETLSDGSNANALHVHSEYKLVSSISANDLVLALKDLDGNDFSATSQLKTKLSDELATISGALSITVPDGTNWANLGSNELKTQDADLFTYLVDETGASAGTKLAWSRIPNGHFVGDFSSTTTNEKYLAGPTNYNATDKVQNIGRFNATLSAGAGYTWTIPATSIIINNPTIHTRWLTWLPTFGNLTVGDGTLAAKYWISDDVLSIWFAFKYGASTSAIAGAVSISLPISIANAAVAASLGTCNLLDSGVGTTYASIDSNGASANNVRVRVITASGTYAALAPISATVPFTWAVNDEINFQLPSLPLA